MLGNDLGIYIAESVMPRPIIRPRGWQLSRGRHDAGKLHGLIGPTVLGLAGLNEDLFAGRRGTDFRHIERSDVRDAGLGSGTGTEGRPRSFLWLRVT